MAPTRIHEISVRSLESAIFMWAFQTLCSDMSGEGDGGGSDGGGVLGDGGGGLGDGGRRERQRAVSRLRPACCSLRIFSIRG